MRRLGAAVAVLALCLVAVGPAFSAGMAATGKETRWEPYRRPARYEVIKIQDVPVTMSDGTVLMADIYRPDGRGRFPVILTQTPYNKSGVRGTDDSEFNEYLVERGYVQVVVDVRGTGGSEGSWALFSKQEQRDGYELVEWAAKLRWSNGNVGLWGSSYRAINQLYTAALRPPHLRAIFPIVPAADAYRDLVMIGGQFNAAFMPIFLAYVTAEYSTPPTYAASDPVRALTTWLGHTGSATSFHARWIGSMMTGGDLAYDGPFWHNLAPIRIVDRIRVPTFLVGGLRDLFQRGTPMLYEELRGRVPTKLLMGWWTHGEFRDRDDLNGLPDKGLPATLNEIALRWFDHYLSGVDTDVKRIPPVTQYVFGQDRYVVQEDWPHPQSHVDRYYLRTEGGLTQARPEKSEDPDELLTVPGNGACSGSTDQWLLGLLRFTPCREDNRLTELTEVVYSTPPLKQDLYISGPMGAEVWVEPSASEATLSVRVTDVAPSGASRELSAGLLDVSLRALDRSKSRVVGDDVLQPWHPYTRQSVLPVRRGKPVRLNIELFPINAVFEKGHQLRVTLGSSDFSHASPADRELEKQIGRVILVLHDPRHPSFISFPVAKV